MDAIASLYWYRPQREVWYMLVTNDGSYLTAPCCQKISNSSISVAACVDKIFEDINSHIAEDYSIILKYHTFRDIDYFNTPIKEALLLDRAILDAIDTYGFELHNDCFKKEEVKTETRKLVKRILSPLFNKLKAREQDLWANAFHKNSPKQLARDLWKIVRGATGQPVMRGDINKLFEPEYLQLLKESLRR